LHSKELPKKSQARREKTVKFSTEKRKARPTSPKESRIRGRKYLFTPTVQHPASRTWSREREIKKMDQKIRELDFGYVFFRDYDMQKSDKANLVVSSMNDLDIKTLN